MNKKYLFLILVSFTLSNYSMEEISEDAQNALKILATDQDFISPADKELVMHYNWRLPELKEEADIFWIALANNDIDGAQKALDEIVYLTTGVYTLFDTGLTLERENIVSIMQVTLLRLKGMESEAVAAREEFERFKEILSHLH